MRELNFSRTIGKSILTRTRLLSLKPILSVVAFSLVLVAFTSNARAVIAGTTLNDLVQGGSITVVDKLFDNWAVTQNSVNDDISGKIAFNLANINVTGDPTDPLNPGLIFTTLSNELSITAIGNTTAMGQLEFLFDVTVLDPRMRWKDNTLQAEFGHTDGAFPNNQSAHIHEFLYGTRVGDVVSDLFGEKDRHLIHDDGFGGLDDQSGIPDIANFLGRTSGTVRKDISLEVHSQGEGVELISFEQYFSQHVPDSGSSALMLGLGILALAGLKRRLRKA